MIAIITTAANTSYHIPRITVPTEDIIIMLHWEGQHKIFYVGF